MPLSVRYAGSWLRFDIVAPLAIGVLLTAATIGITRHPPPGATRPVLIGFWIFSLIWFAAAAQAITSILRFRLTIDQDSVRCRGVFGESSHGRAEVTRLGWAVIGPYTQRSLRFYDAAEKILISLDASLLKPVQVAEVSRVMGIPFEDSQAR